MGLFDRFKGGAKGETKGKATSFARWAEKAGDKRAQDYDRQEAIRELADLGTPEAVEALLKRFGFTIDPSITDQDEKDAAFRGILRAGEAALAPLRAHVTKADSLGWPMKILKELTTPEQYIDELILWLRRWDTEYSKFIDPKLQLLVALEEQKNSNIVDAVIRFLDDVNESARFHAVGSLLAQDDVRVIDALSKGLANEESVRVRNRILRGFAARDWRIPSDRVAAVQGVVTTGVRLDRDGRVLVAAG
jgi:HEAT repeat protein